jgi:hypothetical protein
VGGPASTTAFAFVFAPASALAFASAFPAGNVSTSRLFGESMTRVR